MIPLNQTRVQGESLSRLSVKNIFSASCNLWKTLFVTSKRMTVLENLLRNCAQISWTSAYGNDRSWWACRTMNGTLRQSLSWAAIHPSRTSGRTASRRAQGERIGCSRYSCAAPYGCLYLREAHLHQSGCTILLVEQNAKKPSWFSTLPTSLNSEMNQKSPTFL